MNPKLLLALIVMLSWLLAAGCGEDSKPAPPAPPAPSPTAESTPPPRPAEPTGAWPFLSGDESAGTLAENLTARNFLLIFDGSGSMEKSECSGAISKLDAAKQAVAAWSKSVPADANLGLYAFHKQGILTLPLASHNRDLFIEAVHRIQAGGTTPLDSAMWNAYQSFTAQGKRQLGYGEYTIVVVTDGIANDAKLLQQAVDMVLTQSPINIYSIGFCIDDRHSLNQPGRTLYRSADNPQQLEQGLRDVLAESESFDARDFTE